MADEFVTNDKNKVWRVRGSTFLLAVERKQEWVCLESKPCNWTRAHNGKKVQEHKGHKEEFMTFLEPLGQLSRTSNGPRGLVTRHNSDRKGQGRDENGLLVLVRLDEAEPIDSSEEDKLGAAERSIDAVTVRAQKATELMKKGPVEIPKATKIKKPRRKRVDCRACGGSGDANYFRQDNASGPGTPVPCLSCGGTGKVLK